MLKSCFFFKLVFFISVNLNFFVEKHGKNLRDAHFSNIAKFVKAESLTRRLVCSQDIVDAILKRQNMANDNNKGSSKSTQF